MAPLVLPYPAVGPIFAQGDRVLLARDLAFWVALGFSLACNPSPYTPGALLSPPTCDAGPQGAVVASRRVGCIDVRIALACNRVVAPNRPLVAFAFGNWCDAPATIDFTKVRVTARDADPGDQPMTAFDPRGEIRPAVLDARGSGREVVEFDGVADDRPVHSLCIDVSSLAEGGDAVPTACLARPVDACKASP
jgi:hypothetical protein